MGGRGGRGDPTHSGFRVGAGDTREKLAGGLLFSRRAPRRRTRSGGGPRARARARSRVPRGRARARRRGAKARILAGRAVHARLNLSSLSGERMRPSAIARESEIEGGSADWCHEFSFPRRDSASAGRRRAAPVRGAGAACPRDRERRGSARSRDAGGDDRARARGRSEWRADARGTAPFRGSNAPNGRRGRPGTALGCRCPARIDRSGIFSQCSRQREKLPRRRAKTRVEKNSVPRTPRSNARSGRGPRPEERPRDVMRLCFTTSHPPARALPLAAAVVVVVALGPPLHVKLEKKFLIITRRASVLPRPSSPSDHHPGVLVSSVYSFALRLFFPFTRPRSWGS